MQEIKLANIYAKHSGQLRLKLPHSSGGMKQIRFAAFVIDSSIHNNDLPDSATQGVTFL